MKSQLAAVRRAIRVVLWLVVAWLPVAAAAQAPARVLRIGLLVLNSLRPDALLTFTDPVTNSALDRVFEVARRQRMPTMCEFREFAQRGCLITYGATLAEFHDRVARFVERILKGARPADLPMEQATRFELVVNQKAAREIGMRIPAEILMRADHVIE